MSACDWTNKDKQAKVLTAAVEALRTAHPDFITREGTFSATNMRVGAGGTVTILTLHLFGEVSDSGIVIAGAGFTPVRPS